MNNWLPRKFGGGLGNSRKGGKEVNETVSGRVQQSSSGGGERRDERRDDRRDDRRRDDRRDSRRDRSPRRESRRDDRDRDRDDDRRR